MADPILDEIWRVRAELVKRYGGFKGYWDHFQKLDEARRRRRRKKNAAKRRNLNSKATA